jgi:hypothetical protein
MQTAKLVVLLRLGANSFPIIHEKKRGQSHSYENHRKASNLSPFRAKWTVPFGKQVVGQYCRLPVIGVPT